MGCFIENSPGTRGKADIMLKIAFIYAHPFMPCLKIQRDAAMGFICFAVK